MATKMNPFFKMIDYLQTDLVTFAGWLRLGEYLGLVNCNLI